MIGSSTGWTGILEYWMESFAVCVYFGFFFLFFYALIYIFPARFIHTFGWNCEANGGALYIDSFLFAW